MEWAPVFFNCCVQANTLIEPGATGLILGDYALTEMATEARWSEERLSKVETPRANSYRDVDRLGLLFEAAGNQSQENL